MRPKDFLAAFLSREPSRRDDAKRCELVVMVKPFAHPDDVAMDARLLKEGHVIEVVPAGWRYGREERRNPNWIKLRVLGLSVDEGHALRMDQNGDPSRNLLKRRHVKIDLGRLAVPLDPERIVHVTVDELRAAVVVEPLLPRPDYVGHHRPEVIA